MTILQVWFPFLRRFKRNGKEVRAAQDRMRDIGLGLISEREAEARDAVEKGLDGNETILGRDLLSVLGMSVLSFVKHG